MAVTWYDTVGWAAPSCASMARPSTGQPSRLAASLILAPTSLSETGQVILAQLSHCTALAAVHWNTASNRLAVEEEEKEEQEEQEEEQEDWRRRRRKRRAGGVGGR